MNDYFQQLSILWQDIINHPGTSFAVICNLLIIESLLSVDNAAVLATMVMDLPKEQRGKALKYGIWGAYIFRGLAMIFAAFLIKIWWLKPIGGLYLLYLVYDWYKGKQTETVEDDFFDKKSNWLYKVTVGSLGTFWATVCLVELMDMAFSIDNVFAVVAFTPNIILICIGVFIGIFAMRFIAQWFVKLMEKYTFLETCAFVVIGILGLKLVFSLYTHFEPCSQISVFMEGNNACLASQGLPIPEVHSMVWGDIGTSILTVSIFFIPILTSIFFNFPKKGEVSESD
jgi:YkoY family integral membrane protein